MFDPLDVYIPVDLSTAKIEVLKCGERMDIYKM